MLMFLPHSVGTSMRQNIDDSELPTVDVIEFSIVINIGAGVFCASVSIDKTATGVVVVEGGCGGCVVVVVIGVVVVVGVVVVAAAAAAVVVVVVDDVVVVVVDIVICVDRINVVVNDTTELAPQPVVV
jgi:hypothetical protein